MEEIILASTSPRRKYLLESIGINLKIIKPNYDENIIAKSFSYKKIETIAERKCDSVIKLIKDNAIIISADTVVIFNNKVMGKPKSFEEAYKMLSTLNNKTHKVVTAICIKDNEKKRKIIKTETSEVSFNLVKERDIKRYIEEYKPYDKAGSYGIQELPQYFIKDIQGEYDNIVGLPTKLLKSMLIEITGGKI